MDRLTRSLAGFAKIVEVLDAHGASFVSVTQQFNTATSMGRLTLNMLLSFAQFEREVAGERIRDKIAASKRKGMWMGGTVPLGYDVRDRKLVVNEAEANTVRHVFRSYLALGSVRLLQERHRHQKVAPGVADQSLDLAFVIALARAAKAIGEQVVGLQLGKDPGALPRAITKDARRRQLGVVVQHALRHTAEECERRIVPVAERLRRLRRIGPHEARVAVRQIHRQEVDALLHPTNHRNRLAKVGLAVPGRMDQGHEHLLPAQPPLPDVVLHDRLATREAVLCHQPLKYPPRRMPLLARPPLVLLQDPVDHRQQRVELGPHRRLAAPVPRRHGKPQHLGHRLGVDAEDPGRLPLAHAIHMAGTPNPRIKIHDFHPKGLPSAVLTKG